MLSKCHLLAVLNEGLLRIDTSYFSDHYGAQLWTRVKLRKSGNRIKKCCNCDEALPPGTVAFSPLTNGYNRMHRLCSGCVERMKNETP